MAEEVKTKQAEGVLGDNASFSGYEQVCT